MGVVEQNGEHHRVFSLPFVLVCRPNTTDVFVRRPSYGLTNTALALPPITPDAEGRHFQMRWIGMQPMQKKQIYVAYSRQILMVIFLFVI